MQDKPYPLDYIMNVPRHLRDPKVSEQVQINAFRLENALKNVVIRRLTEIRAVKDKPSMKDWIDEYLKQRGEKDERSRVRIKDQVLQIYEAKSFAQFEEHDPNFNKVIVHIERVLKVTTAQTLAIDSLERKIMSLSKRQDIDSNDLMIPKKIIPVFGKDQKKGQSDEGEDSEEQKTSSKMRDNKKEVKFCDIFTDIKEDLFESSDDGEEKRKNKRLERLALMTLQQKDNLSRQKEEQENLKRSKRAQKEMEQAALELNQRNNILLGENGDILARYRIPQANNQVDYNL